MTETSHRDLKVKPPIESTCGSPSEVESSQSATDTPPLERIQPKDATPEAAEPAQQPTISTTPVMVGGDRAFFTQKPCFTPEIERTARQVAYWQTLDRPGALIEGLNRIGKTFAARYLAESIELILGGSEMAVLWPLRSADKSDVDFLKQRIDDIGARDYNHNQKGELSRRLVKHLLGRANATNRSRILLIIDEAQIITESQFSIVCDVQEALAKHYAVFTALFGQPELKTIGDSFKEKGIKNLVSRYLKLTHQMRGISENDFSIVLERLDMATGLSVVQLHFPNLYAAGWRLQNIAPALKAAVADMRTAARIAKPVRLPMEDLRSAVNALLYIMVACIDGDPRKFVRKSVLVACLKNVSFHNYIHLYQED